MARSGGDDRRGAYVRWRGEEATGSATACEDGGSGMACEVGGGEATGGADVEATRGGEATGAAAWRRGEVTSGGVEASRVPACGEKRVRENCCAGGRRGKI